MTAYYNRHNNSDLEVLMSRRKRIAILVGQADEYYQAEFICGFEEQAFSYGWDVLIFSTYQKYQSSTWREQGETSVFSIVPYEDLDGIILMLDTLQTPGLADAVEEAAHRRAKCPVISVDKQSKYFFSIFPNHYEGVKFLISHLIEKHGLKDIAFLTGKAWHPYSKERMQAYKDAMEEHGLEIKNNRMFYGDFWYTSGENLGDRLAKDKDNLPEAIACANDCMAIGVAKALADNGIRIPEDVAVIGYDSNEEGRLSPVPITSARLPAGAFGKYAAEAVKIMEEGGTPEAFSNPVDLFTGSSCGCEMKAEDCILALRPVWDTNTSSNSVFSNFNHLDDDLLSQNNLYGIISTLFTYVYQLREFESFNICINDGWEHFGLNAKDFADDGPAKLENKTEAQIDYDFLADPDNFFSGKMANVMTCRPEKFNCDRIGLDMYFDRKDLVPRLDEDRDRPEAFIFSPLHFDNRCFGYAVVSYTTPSSYGDSYRLWLRSLMRGLEIVRRQIVLTKKNEDLESNLIRDPLTGLYNYRGFTQQVDGLLFRYKGSGIDSIGALAVDVRNLSEINNKDGRTAGDKAIVYLGRFIQEAFPEGNVFSFGNGEIIVVDALTDEGKKKFEESITGVRSRLAEFSKTHNYTVPLDVYYGYAEGSPEDRNEFERISSIAVTNKNAYKLRIRSLTDSDSTESDSNKQAEMVNMILDQNKIKYAFQPIIDARTGDIFAYEALMRVDSNPYIQPPVVLKFAELFGRLYDVEAATFNNILDIIDTRTSDFREGAKVFINSIPGQRLKGSDADNLIEMTKRHCNMVVVEFTEENEMSDSELSDMKKDYSDMGVEIAIDDYGTGYSNVSNLLRYMPRYLKIDRSLLTEIHMSPHKQHFVKDIISFSHDNNILALAEGVETQEELATVIFLGVDLIQGYYTARPSEQIIKEIDPAIKAEIIRYNRLEEEDRNKSIYVAGRESRIQLQNLISSDYKGIRVINGEVTYRDVTITGIPGVTSEICLFIENGYSGRITLENVYFSGKKKNAAIIVGEGCDITLVLKGENILESGGICVPASSSLLIEGDGNLNISVNDIESFGIGNGADQSAGNITFDQDGSVDITLYGSKGICIGGGKGAGINIKRGRYFFRMTGQEGVAIGTLTGDTAPVIVNCAINLTTNMMNSVGIGSLSGSLDLKLEHISLTSELNGNDISVIGTLSSARTDINIYSVSLQSRFSASRGLMFGSLSTGPSNIDIDYATVKLECEGKQVSFFRGTDKDSVLKLSNGHYEGRIVSGMEVPLKFDGMDFTHSNVGASVTVNGESLYDGTY